VNPVVPPVPGYGPGVWMLAAGQTLGYACFFYIFAALILHWQADLGWSKTVLAAGPTLAILIAAVLAPLLGRASDLGHGPRLLTGGALIGAGSLAVLASAQTPAQYLLAWAGLGVAQGCSLYEICFALMIRRFGDRARGAITRVTLVAGLASTLAFPAAAALAGAYGWRTSVWIAAAVVLCVMVPLHHFGARAVGRAAGDLPPAPPPRGQAMAALRNRAFWLLALVFCLVNLNHWMVVSFLLPILSAKGASAGLAVLAASCIGPAQVLGRLVLMQWEARIGARAATRATMAGLVLGTLCLIAAGLGPAVVLAFAAVQGAAMGVMTILRPVLVAALMGRSGYGAVAGLLSIPSQVATAAAPMLGAVLFGAGGAALLTGTALVLAVLALALSAALAPQD